MKNFGNLIVEFFTKEKKQSGMVRQDFSVQDKKRGRMHVYI